MLAGEEVALVALTLRVDRPRGEAVLNVRHGGGLNLNP